MPLLSWVKKKALSRELELFEMLKKHIELSIKACELVVHELTASIDEKQKIDVWASQVVALEKEGDRLVSIISSKLMKGAIAITIAGSASVLTDKMDDILDELYYIAMEVKRGRSCNLDNSAHVLDIYSDVAKMIMIGKVALERLRDLVSIALSDYVKAKELDSEVDIYEDQVDEMKSYTLDKLYRVSESISSIAVIHLIELIRAADGLLDACEDSAHLILDIVSALIA